MKLTGDQQKEVEQTADYLMKVAGIKIRSVAVEAAMIQLGLSYGDVETDSMKEALDEGGKGQQGG